MTSDAASRSLMPIGRFARACRLSVKALRHYHDLGLLRPAVVDPQTGYRYYGCGQVRDAVAIGMLRALDLPLPAIPELLASDDAAAIQRVLAEQRRRQEQRLARTRASLQVLGRLLAAGELLPSAVSVRQEPDRHALFLGGATSAERLEDDTTALVRRVFALAGELRCGVAEPIYCLLPALEEPLTIEVCLPVDCDEGAQAEAAVRPLPGGPFAVVRHVGPYATLGLAHHALFAWAQERGHETAGPLREAYLNDPDEVDPEDLVTEVLLPIAEAGPTGPAREEMSR